jgi:tRNA A37 methylthiotransferase MiaB
LIAVTGCYAQLKPDEIAAIDGVDIVLGNNYKGDLYQQVLNIASKGHSKVLSCDCEAISNFFSAFSTADRSRSFLKVQDGCDYKCAYCTIHYARGCSRNAPIAELVKQAESVAHSGIKEIVITGVNTGDFGRTTGESFLDLLKALAAVDGKSLIVMLPWSKDEQAASGAGVEAGTARLGQFGEAVLLQEDEWVACIEGGTHDGFLAGRDTGRHEYCPTLGQS